MDFDTLSDFLSRQRAIRIYDTSKAVDDATIEKLLRAATYAPNGGNRQTWRFIVIRDADTKAKLADIYEDLAEKTYPGSMARATSWREVPVFIAFCTEGRPGAAASLFPALQNFLLGVHAMGLGSVLTTLWKAREEEVRAILGVPDGVEMHAILPLGWPDRKYGRGSRRPVAEVTFREGYGKAW